MHRMDGRLKLLCMLIMSLSAGFASEWWHYLTALCFMFLALFVAKLPITSLLKDMKFFAFLILIVFTVNAFGIPGDPIPKFPITSVSIQGVIEGLRFAGRFTVIIMACSIMTGTTSLLTFKNVIEWYLRPVPFIPEVQIATMINLTFVLIPVIFDNYSEMMSAQKSRCIQLRKNPIERINFIVLPLLSRTLRRADEIVYAMESRCYSEVRTRAIFRANKVDWHVFAVCMAFLICVVI